MKEFYLGLMVGLVQTGVGHPLDTIKTNFQNKTSLDLKKNKLKTLYRGVKYPLFASVLTNGCLFYSNKYFFDQVENHFYSGFMTGIICSPLINGFETMKVQHQVNEKSLSYKNKFKTLKLGFSATLVRESFGASLYFGTYNYLKKDHNSFVSGSIAGVTSWLFTYPIDVVKTRLQSGNSKNWTTAISRGGLLNGLAICLLRSFIVNGFSFALYDYIKNLE
jgi:solute carrier family 25 carnitine/acylcarnitine transporter 20/29